MMPHPRPEIPWSDLYHRYFAALGESWVWVAVMVGIFVTLMVPLQLGKPKHVPKWAPWVGTGLVVAFGIGWAWHLRWLSDDAFISFRYAANLVEGKGLVFNEGERVEGYTNFLWTVAMALFTAVRVGPIWGSVVLSLASFAGVLILITKLVREHAPEGSPVVVSFAAIAFAGNYASACYATSGLETMFAALLALLALERAIAKRPMQSGFAGIAATMAHPDHAIFYAALAVVLLLDDERRGGFYRYSLPFFVLFVPYFGWRYWYYGSLFPNTYYAKSADLAYFSQGWVYVVVTVVGAGLFTALPLAIFGAVKLRDEMLARYGVFATTLFVLYVAKVGGDFMFARLLVPAMPVVFVLAESGARWGLASKRRWGPPLAVGGSLAFGFAAVPTRIIQPLEKAWHIADERSFYRIISIEPLALDSVYPDWGEDLNDHVVSKGLRPRVAISSVGIVSYLTRLPMVDTYGLTDETIAHQQLAWRGRPGHEKVASPGYLASRGIDLSEIPVYPERYLGFTHFWLDGLRYFMPRYRTSFLDPLRGDQHVSFLDFPRFLDRYDPFVSGRELDALFCDAWFFDQFYFRHNDDEPRRRAVRQRVAAANPSLFGLEEFLLGSPPDDGEWKVVHRFDFEDRGEGWSAAGFSFRHWPSHREVPGQTMVTGQSGGFVSSFAAAAGDLAMGKLTSPAFEIVGDVMTFRIGGGQHAKHLRVSLVIDDEQVFSSTGCDSEMMGTRVWNVAPLAGKTATIEIFDGADYPWGHLVVDSVVQWKRSKSRLPRP